MASTIYRLLPFIVTASIYIFHWIPTHQSTPEKHDDEHFLSVFAKCIPIISLCGFVVSYMPNHPAKNYPHLILLGLVFSCFGDAFLVYAGTYFIQGLLSFAIGHIMYTVAFGFKQLKLPIMFVFCAPIGILSYIYLYPGLRGELVYFSGLYSFLICLMNWRAMAKVNFADITWPELCGCLGALSFYISDLVLAVNKFRYPVPNGYYIIMSTYYLGQLGISLSVVPVLSKKKLY